MLFPFPYRCQTAPPSLRAQRSNPDSLRGYSLDCFVAPLLAMTSIIIPAALFRPGFASSHTLFEKRAQGMPDAGRTREPCVQRKVHIAHASNPGTAGTTGIPCAMVLTAAPRSPRCTGLVSHRRPRQSSRGLDPSVGGTGPHGLAVREKSFRPRASAREASSRPPHPASHVRDDRDTPL